MNTKVLVAYGFLSLLVVNGFAALAVLLGVTGFLFLVGIIAFVFALVWSINTVLDYEHAKDKKKPYFRQWNELK